MKMIAFQVSAATILSMIFTTAVCAAVKGDDFGSVVKMIEQFYRVKHQGIPFFAKAGMKAATTAARLKGGAARQLAEAGSAFTEIMSAHDKNIPGSILDKADCVVIIPNMVKGGFIFGGKGGKGVATCRTANGWSAPAFITISGGNWVCRSAYRPWTWS